MNLRVSVLEGLRVFRLLILWVFLMTMASTLKLLLMFHK